ncbi:hypothetical protein UK82_03985 [Frankia sp. ACN1ag]|nr:hypothetical protein UK82_03985 [Frankia sp. ACN1ag]
MLRGAYSRPSLPQTAAALRTVRQIRLSLQRAGDAFLDDSFSDIAFKEEVFDLFDHAVDGELLRAKFSASTQPVAE